MTEHHPAQPWLDAATDSYPDDLYRFDGLAEGVDTFAEVGEREIEAFRRQGFLVVRQAFTPAEIQLCLDAFLDLIAGRNPDFRGIQYEVGTRSNLDHLPPERKQDFVRKFWKFVEYDARLMAFSRHPALLNALARIMEDTPEMFQDMALLKPPGIGREKPWHQDCAYFNLPVSTAIVGVWIALDRATPENGCMRVRPGSHLEGPMVHFHRRDWQICDSHVRRDGILAVPLPPGGCLLFHGLLQHGTPANRTYERRRAVQFHYKPAAIEWGRPDERLALFGSEGKDATC